MPLRVAIHQPNYLPWSGYFSKMMHCDIFVFLDDVQFSKNSFINRNRIKGQGGPEWLTIPVHASTKKTICEIEPAGDRWIEKHIRTLDCLYRASPYYETYSFGIFESLRLPFTTIDQLNMRLIMKLAEMMDISCKFLKSSDLAVQSAGDNRIVDIVKKVGGTVYVSGSGAAAYQNKQKFTDADVNLLYLAFRQVDYFQLWGDFEPNLSIVDLLFNVGSESKAVIAKSGHLVTYPLTE